MPIVNKSGHTTIDVPVGQKVIVGTLGNGWAVVFSSNKPSSQPEQFYELGRVQNGSKVFGPFTSECRLDIQAPIGSACEYAVGVSPSLSTVGVKSTGQLATPNLSADPAGATKGDFYFNSTTNKLKVFNGTAWETITSA